MVLPGWLFEPIRRLYAELVSELLRALRRAVSRWLRDPAGETSRRTLNRETWALVVEFDQRAAPLTRGVIIEANERGRSEGSRDIENPVSRIGPLDVIESALAAHQARPSHLAIVRSVDDAYREVTTVAAGDVATGRDRRDAAQRALDEFAVRGITGFVDRAGQRWELASYVEMAVRTVAARAMIAAQLEELSAAGVDLVVVPYRAQGCPLCRRAVGRVYSITGATSGYPALSSARSAGLFHPGCRCGVMGVQPGIARRRAPVAGQNFDDDPDRRRLRYLERQVRATKRRELVALDDGARYRARARTRAWQAAIREHVTTTSARRQPARERISRAR